MGIWHVLPHTYGAICDLRAAGFRVERFAEQRHSVSFEDISANLSSRDVCHLARVVAKNDKALHRAILKIMVNIA